MIFDILAGVAFRYFLKHKSIAINLNRSIHHKVSRDLPGNVGLKQSRVTPIMVDSQGRNEGTQYTATLPMRAGCEDLAPGKIFKDLVAPS